MTEEIPKPPSGSAVPAEERTADQPPTEPGEVAAAVAVEPREVGRRRDGPITRETLRGLLGEIAGHFPAPDDRTELVLMDVDPHHLHAYWNIRQSDLARALRALGPGGPQGPMLLRVREVLPDGGDAPSAGEVFDVAVHGLRNRWYVDVWKDGASYEAALGLRGANGRVEWLARSQPALAPRAGQSPDYAFPKLTVPTAETRLADLPKGVPFDRPRIDPRFADLYPQPEAAMPLRGWPASLLDHLEVEPSSPEAAGTDAPAIGEVPADLALLPAGVSPGATDVPTGAEPPPRSDLPASDVPGELPADLVPAGAAAPSSPAAGAPPGRVADAAIAALASGEPPPADPAEAERPAVPYLGMPAEVSAARDVPSGPASSDAHAPEAGPFAGETPAGAAAEPAAEQAYEREPGLGAMAARLAETMDTVPEPTASNPAGRLSVPGTNAAPDAVGPAVAFAPGRGAVFGADIDQLGAPFGPRGEPVTPQPEPDRQPSPEAANGARQPDAAAREPGGGDEPMPLESVLSLSSFAFGREDVSLEVNAELHIFGRARPGAKLTMFGQRLRLLPDGSFSIRRPLPHGSLVLPILMSQGAGEGGGGGD